MIRRAALAVALSFSLQAAPPAEIAFAQTQKKAQKGDKPQAPRPADMDQTGIVILVKSALLALDHANKTGNYSVLRDLGSPNFQAKTAADLAEIFAAHRNQKLNLAAILVLDPQLTLQPQIESNGMLHIAGFFPSVPAQLNFEMLWEPLNRQWRLYGLSVTLSSGGPEASESPVAIPSTTLNEQPPRSPESSITIDPATQVSEDALAN